MLTDKDKERIREEEEYKAKLKKEKPEHKNFSQKLTAFFEWFDGPGKFFQTLAIAAGIVLTVQQYSANSRSERTEAAREYQKSFYQAQMAVYTEAVNETAALSTAVPDSPEYLQARQKFYQLFWGRMSIFENKCVEARMVEFRKLLIKFDQKDYTPIQFIDACSPFSCYYDTVDQVALKKASLRLAHECRVYTINTWLPENERKSYNLIDSSSCNN
jgi:hypothetical protein